MQSRPRMFKRGRSKHRCKWCNRSAVFCRQDGSIAADAQHDLCKRCFERALELGEEAARREGILTRRK